MIRRQLELRHTHRRRRSAILSCGGAPLFPALALAAGDVVGPLHGGRRRLALVVSRNGSIDLEDVARDGREGLLVDDERVADEGEQVIGLGQPQQLRAEEALSRLEGAPDDARQAAAQILGRIARHRQVHAAVGVDQERVCVGAERRLQRVVTPTDGFDRRLQCGLV